MTADLYLIAHKVRGEPTFDVAVPLKIEQEQGWIIPISGHRAHPYWTVALKTLGYDMLADGSVSSLVDAMPLNWPDYYSINDRKPSRPMKKQRRHD